jgi:hypothetical protein
MPQFAVGAAAIADVGKTNPATGMRQYDIKGMFSQPSTWAFIYFGLSVAILGGLYFGFGGYKGDVAS